MLKKSMLLKILLLSPLALCIQVSALDVISASATFPEYGCPSSKPLQVTIKNLRNSPLTFYSYEIGAARKGFQTNSLGYGKASTSRRLSSNEEFAETFWSAARKPFESEKHDYILPNKSKSYCILPQSAKRKPPYEGLNPKELDWKVYMLNAKWDDGHFLE